MGGWLGPCVLESRWNGRLHDPGQARLQFLGYTIPSVGKPPLPKPEIVEALTSRKSLLLTCLN